MTEQLQAQKNEGNKRELCAEDETPWETKEATSEVAGGWVECVCEFEEGGGP